MAREFYIRLRKYYQRVAEVLRGDAEAASVFPNTTDIGQSRERIYARRVESDLIQVAEMKEVINTSTSQVAELTEMNP